MKIANPFERFGITQADYDGNENYGRFVIEPLERGFGLTTPLKLKVLVMNSPLFQVLKKTLQPSS